MSYYTVQLGNIISGGVTVVAVVVVCGLYGLVACVPVSDVAEVVVGDVVKVVALRYSSYNLHGGTFRSLTLCVCP